MNVLTVVVLIMLAIKGTVYLDPWLVIGLFVIFQIVTYIRYIYKTNHTIEQIEQVWLNKTESNRRLTRALLVVYGIGSVLSFGGLAVYLGIKR